MAIFISFIMVYLSVPVCFIIGDGVNRKHWDRGAMEYGLIHALNGMLGMENVIPMEKMKNVQNHGVLDEKLNMDSMFEQFYQHIRVESLEEEIAFRGPDQFQIIIKILDKKPMTIWVSSNTTVKSIKLKIRKRKRGPPIYQQRLMYKGKELKDLQTMTECGINGHDGVAPTLHLLLRLRGGGFAHYYLNPEYFDPKFDRDFRNTTGYGKMTSYRGGYVYRRPYGSMRYAIKVLGKYADNNWLNKPPNSGQSESEQEEKNQEIAVDPLEEGWPVAYHGTSDMNAIGIAKEGFRVDKGKRSVFGNGIYATPYPETALKYAKEYEYNGTKYKLIIQTRVDPSKLQVVLQEFNYGLKDEYWLLPDGDAIRPYGICVYEVNDEDDEDDMFIHNIDF